MAVEVDVEIVLRDEEWREAVAEQSYLRERADEAAADREHDDDENAEYLAVAWESLSDWAKRPYRTAVAETADNILRVMEPV